MKNEMDEPRVVGVIDIGSTAIRMAVMEIDRRGAYRRVDRASRPVVLGRDVFMNRIISRDSMSLSIKILNGFLELFKSYNIEPDSIFTIATSAIRESKNRDTFIDRVFMRTGLRIHIVDGIEENHLTYIAVLHAIESMTADLARTSSVIMEVGGGSTELMIMDRGKMVAAHSFRLGTQRMDVQQDFNVEGDYSRDILIEQFRSTIMSLHAEFNLAKVRYLVLIGGEARLVAAHFGEKRGEHYAVIKRPDFLGFIDKIATYSVPELVKSLNITYYEAENLLPALLVHRLFLEETSAEEIVVPDVSIREGVLLRFALGPDKKAEQAFRAQIIASARSLGKRYRFDEAHGVHVAALALSFFDAFLHEHGLSDRDRLYLEVAALLHDIGYFIRASGHHKHGQYIICNSEIFGLTLDELHLIGQMVRYHRATRPLREHQEFSQLSQEQRISVLKLTAILRVCDALDRSHVQRVKNIRLDLREGDELYLYTDVSGDLTMERIALQQKGDVFEEVFGYRLILAEGR